jgi:Cu2+-exporting ATPase
MASAERDSEHMLSRAIVNAAGERHLSLPESSGFRAIPGRGVEARVEGHAISVGGPRLLEQMQIEVPEELHEQAQKAASAGQTLVYLIQDSRVLAAAALADVIRSESREAVSELGRLGVRVAMMTGDSQDVARWVADQLGITEYYANVLPEDKAKRIEDIRKQGRRVAMVGDGVNDAPALVTADVGIAIGAGTDVAIEAGGIILVKNDPRDIVSIIKLSRASYRKMIQNLVWATGYNVVAIPLAAGVLAGYGIILPPAVGAIFMSVSTVIVALNAQLLRRLQLHSAD